MHSFLLTATVLVAAAHIGVLASQQSVVTIDDDDITIRGCVRKVDLQGPDPGTILVWSRGDIVSAAVTALVAADAPSAVGTSGISGRVFYWLDDDDDLAKHVGQLVHIEGNLEDFEEGEVEIDRDGDFTDIEVDLDGRKEKARIPTSWLRGVGAHEDQEFDIVTRRIDVDDIHVVGACNLP